MQSTIEEQLIKLADKKYQKFSAALVPNAHNILGVHLPALHQLAKTIAAENSAEYLKTAQDNYFEETMLQGLVIGYMKCPLPERLIYIKNFIPKINNWSVCDSFCSNLKFTQKYLSDVLEFMKPYIHSKQEFELRFVIIMLRCYYVNEQYLKIVLKIIDRIRYSGYYVMMGKAWTLSECYIKFPEQTMLYLRDNSLDDLTYNKTLQKIIESYRVSDENKKLIRTMKRKTSAKQKK